MITTGAKFFFGLGRPGASWPRSSTAGAAAAGSAARSPSGSTAASASTPATRCSRSLAVGVAVPRRRSWSPSATPTPRPSPPWPAPTAARGRAARRPATGRSSPLRRRRRRRRARVSAAAVRASAVHRRHRRWSSGRCRRGPTAPPATPKSNRQIRNRFMHPIEIPRRSAPSASAWSCCACPGCCSRCRKDGADAVAIGSSPSSCSASAVRPVASARSWPSARSSPQWSCSFAIGVIAGGIVAAAHGSRHFERAPASTREAPTTSRAREDRRDRPLRLLGLMLARRSRRCAENPAGHLHAQGRHGRRRSTTRGPRCSSSPASSA